METLAQRKREESYKPKNPADIAEEGRKAFLAVHNPKGTVEKIAITIKKLPADNPIEGQPNFRNMVIEESDKAKEFLGKVLSKETAKLCKVKAQIGPGRAWCGHFRGEMKLSASHTAATWVHETAHMLEVDQTITKANKGFRLAQTQGQDFQKINKDMGTQNPKTEVCAGEIKGMLGFEPSSRYTARIYPMNMATEILAMGFQALYENPEFLAKKNPEYFDYLVNVAQGSYDTKK